MYRNALGWLIVFALIGFTPCATAQEEKSFPFKAYGIAMALSCGDYLRFIEDYDRFTAQTAIFEEFTAGYITCLNSKLPRGGTVLGGKDVKFTDFMLGVENRCKIDPTQPYWNAVNDGLKRLTPCDFIGVPYTETDLK